MSSLTSGRSLLVILAHPDDESFGPGGTLALYASRGVDVHLICATRGELGDLPPDPLPDDLDLGTLREQELSCAADHLGLASVHFLGYRDSGMPGSPENQDPRALASKPTKEVTARLVTLIRRLRPQVVLTFDPAGGYLHPDHVAISLATTRAFHAALDDQDVGNGLPSFQPQKLYYHTFSRRLLRPTIKLLKLLGKDPRHWGRNGDIDLVEIASQEFPVHARIDYRSVLEQKRRAAACHLSQGTPPTRGLTGLLFRLAQRHETFMRAYPPAPEGLRESDLFEGVTPIE